jgi:hypothetical protein
MAMLQTPPDRGHETIAQIWSYGNEQDELSRMQHLIRFEACQLGAHAVILLPAQDVEHVNTFNAYPDWATELSGFGQGAGSVRTRTNINLQPLPGGLCPHLSPRRRRQQRPEEDRQCSK